MPLACFLPLRRKFPDIMKTLPCLIQESARSTSVFCAIAYQTRLHIAELRKSWTQQRTEESRQHQEQRAEKAAKWETKVALLSKLRRRRKAQEATLRQKAAALDAKIKARLNPQ